MSKTKCKSCGSSNSQKLFTSQNVHGRHLISSDKFNIYQCPQCQTAFTDVLVNEDYYKKYYPEDYYETLPKSYILKGAIGLLDNLGYTRHLAIINKYKNADHQRILDVGCGTGEFLNRLPDNFKKYGIEINDNAYTFIKKHYPNIIIYNKKIDSKEFSTSERFDLIVMWHVLEHVDNPHAFFKAIKKFLYKEGTLIFEVPNRDGLGFNIAKDMWFHLDTPRHIFHYNYTALKNILEKNSLQIVSYSADPFSYFHDLLFSLYKKFKQNNKFLDLALFTSLAPITLFIRLILSLFYPRRAEINTYVVKHSSS